MSKRSISKHDNPPDYFASNSESVGDGRDLASRAMVSFLGLYSKFVMHLLNYTEMRRAEVFHGSLHDATRKYKGQGLITVSNHTTAIDDPGALATLISWKDCLNPELMRWTPCATDRCFKNKWSAGILRKGKVVPVYRGAGIMQGWMTDMVSRLDEGEWVHFFPEGTRSRHPGSMGQVRPGVGRLICDAKLAPVVIPFYHYGMEQVLPHGTKVPIPLTAGRKMGIFVGAPILLDDIWSEYRSEMRGAGFQFREAAEELDMMRNARLPRRAEDGSRRSGGGDGRLSAIVDAPLIGQGQAALVRTTSPSAAPPALEHLLESGDAAAEGSPPYSGSSTEPLVLAHPSSDPPKLASPLSYSLPISDAELAVRNRHYARAADRIKEHLLQLELEATAWAREVGHRDGRY